MFIPLNTETSRSERTLSMKVYIDADLMIEYKYKCWSSQVSHLRNSRHVWCMVYRRPPGSGPAKQRKKKIRTEILAARRCAYGERSHPICTLRTWEHTLEGERGIEGKKPMGWMRWRGDLSLYRVEGRAGGATMGRRSTLPVGGLAGSLHGLPNGGPFRCFPIFISIFNI
jgi:hypothetical protein